MTHPIDPKPRNCNKNCPGNIGHKTPASIISRVNYRLAHGVLSLNADDEWLLRDAVFCVMELVAEVENLKRERDTTLFSPNDLKQVKLLAYKMGADTFRRRVEDWLNDTFEYENSVMTVHRVRETLIATTAEMSRIQEDL